ncbi:hypothetical protein B566_EDAN001166 [Ephemera danica]|nr:hypothetical protein B566_EDAN001166 [Ephemera danica]
MDINDKDIMEMYDTDDEYTQEDDPFPPKVKLEDGIYLPDLISGQGAEFKVQSQPDIDMGAEAREQAKVYFTNEHMLEYLRPECVGNSDETDDDLATTPFSDIAKKMVDISADGKLMKRVKKEGAGSVPVVGSHVVLHYNAYNEFVGEPFDSTRLRHIPARFRLGEGACLVGVDQALLTMKKGEKSEFLLHPDLAYGPLGCPPRIPPDATVLFEISLMDHLEPQIANAFENAVEKGKEESSTFPKMMERANAFRKVGGDFFCRELYRQAVTRFEKGISLLQRIAATGEEEDEERQKLLLTLYVNVANCNNKMAQYRQACTNCQRALAIDPESTKGHYHYGKALLRLQDYKRSEYHLKAALRNDPKSEEIGAELIKLEKTWKEAKKNETLMCTKMMKHCQITTPAQEKQKDMSVLTNFERSSNKRLDFPPGICLDSQNLIKGETLRRGLLFIVVPGIDRKGDRFYILKPAPKREEVKESLSKP